MSLVEQLNKWKVAPPEPPQISGGGDSNDKWAHEILNQIDNLLWMIEEKHWKSSIHIQKDVCDRLPHIPESFVRSIVNACGEYPSIRRCYIKNS